MEDSEDFFAPQFFVVERCKDWDFKARMLKKAWHGHWRSGDARICKNFIAESTCDKSFASKRAGLLSLHHLLGRPLSTLSSTTVQSITDSSRRS